MSSLKPSLTTTVSIIALAMMFAVLQSSAQSNISGQVNQYVAVTEVIPCDSMVHVGNQLNFQPGDRVLLIQMKGAEIVDEDVPAFGTITDIAGAGNSEFLTIESVDKERVVFSSRMVHRYNTNGAVQLIKVPVYNDVRVMGPLTAPEWNGTIGGVIAIEATGTVYLDADINADGIGFRGGRVSIPKDFCETVNYLLNWNFGQAGEKGEGIASLGVNYPIAGRGPLVNGGGGGNGNNSGGAGGSLGGKGGNGGFALLHCEIEDVGGIPGTSLTDYVSEQKYFLGGGGGGGHQNDLVGTSGSHGGGIVFIRASVLHGQGRTITSCGFNVGVPPPPPPRKAAGMDGAGGGGAGGTVVLDVADVASPVNVNVRGGDGGDIIHLYNAHGPGGGGSGGIVVLRSSFPNVNVDLGGGRAGTHIDKQNQAYGTGHGATSGEEGTVIAGLSWKKPISVNLEIWGGGAICEDASEVTLEASPGFASYTWSNGATGRVISVGEKGDYSVVAIDPAGCEYRASGVAVWTNPTEFTITEVLDFQGVPLEAYKRMTFPITNDDDEEIVVSSISNSLNFTVIEPLMFPMIIPPGESRNVTIEFYAVEDRTYSESIDIEITSPCNASHTVDLYAVVSPIWTVFSTPDTTAKVGDTTFTIPIRAFVSPDTVDLLGTHLQITLKMDSRIFSPRSISHGRIIVNTIDLISNVRTITVELDSIDLMANDNYVTGITGDVLISTIDRTPVEISDAKWVKVWQVPITGYEPGSIAADPVCFQEGRMILLYDIATMSLSPNPVRDMLHVSTKLSAPGNYSVSIVNTSGSVVHTESVLHDGKETMEHTILVDASRLSNGVYHVRYKTPFVMYTDKFVVQH